MTRGVIEDVKSIGIAALTRKNLVWFSKQDSSYLAITYKHHPSPSFIPLAPALFPHTRTIYSKGKLSRILRLFLPIELNDIFSLFFRNQQVYIP